MTDATSWEAIILAGGEGRRVGGDEKPHLQVGDSTLLERVTVAVSAAVAVHVVGPEVGGGPAAAIASALPRIEAPLVVVLAADLPFIGPAVPLLLAAVDGEDAAVLVDGGGRPNHLAAVWHTAALRRQVERIGNTDGCSMYRLTEGAHITQVPDTGAWGQDCDTPEALESARRRAAST